MSFEEMLLRAQFGDDSAKMKILDIYKPMLIKASLINGRLDEDLYQEQCLTLMKCIERFVV